MTESDPSETHEHWKLALAQLRSLDAAMWKDRLDAANHAEAVERFSRLRSQFQAVMQASIEALENSRQLQALRTNGRLN